MRAVSSEVAQDSFEYLLVIGLVVGGIVAAMWGVDTLIGELAELSCPGIDTASQAVSTCIN